MFLLVRVYHFYLTKLTSSGMFLESSSWHDGNGAQQEEMSIPATYFAIHLYKNQHIIILISYIPIISEKPKPPINYKLDSFDMELFGLFFHFQINIFSSDAMNVLFHFAFVHKVVMQSCESKRQKGKKVAFLNYHY